eukprot:CAMPEP_0194528838 /NCGR_PEP_ID=MMETSP0253-20130528/65347_1 /TAXON_ID=2966 /ORGANISM="Noctiluca scintillans" /LENGTH=170 /DNA_ID=CAMNT_0039373927 /DNA_START=393 /DNA_END=907 /DNA_ORIENTATION=-
MQEDTATRRNGCTSLVPQDNDEAESNDGQCHSTEQDFPKGLRVTARDPLRDARVQATRDRDSRDGEGRAEQTEPQGMYGVQHWIPQSQADNVVNHFSDESSDHSKEERLAVQLPRRNVIDVTNHPLPILNNAKECTSGKCVECPSRYLENTSTKGSGRIGALTDTAWTII